MFTWKCLSFWTRLLPILLLKISVLSVICFVHVWNVFNVSDCICRCRHINHYVYSDLASFTSKIRLMLKKNHARVSTYVASIGIDVIMIGILHPLKMILSNILIEYKRIWIQFRDKSSTQLDKLAVNVFNLMAKRSLRRVARK